MSEQLTYIILFIILGVLFGLQQFLLWQRRIRKERDRTSANQSHVDEIVDSGDLKKMRREVAHITSQIIGVSSEKIQLDVDFERDLRVPPGEMHLLFDEVDESFQIELRRSEISTFKDLLQQICDQRPR
ncbi:MAG: hypothetical protein AAGI48_17320 [Verrucomicrobiota bacterium]